jgi:hypothetical protein
MARKRYDETWHRLLEWTKGQTPSERLAAQILIHEGFSSLDPSHPLGGRDGGTDAIATKDGMRFAMAVYFPRGKQTFTAIRQKFESDLAGARDNTAIGIAFVTNQELTLGQREEIGELAGPTFVALYHLERITAILDAPEMAEVREQFLDIEAQNTPTTNLGGQGGSGPGAGGGGGGAIGEGARGGDGGPGGKIVFEGRPARAPGAGGGGAGALGPPGGIAGDGGGGGDYVRVEIGPEEFQALKAAGFERIEYRVGKGGESGGPGEDTIANFVTADGTVLRSIVAKGGRSGRTTQSDSARQATKADIDGGLEISTAILAEHCYIRDGLLYLLAAGWDIYTVSTVPFAATWPLACAISMGKVDPDTPIAFFARVIDPTGLQVSEVSFVVARSAGSPIARPNVAVVLSFTGSQMGTWTVAIVSGGNTFIRLPIDIRRSS